VRLGGGVRKCAIRKFAEKLVINMVAPDENCSSRLIAVYRVHMVIILLLHARSDFFNHVEYAIFWPGAAVAAARRLLPVPLHASFPFRVHVHL
jgi:hypothetical protein